MYHVTENSSPSMATPKPIRQTNGIGRYVVNKSPALKEGSELNRPISNALSVRATSRIGLVNGLNHYWFQDSIKSLNVRVTLETPLAISVNGITQRLANCHIEVPIYLRTLCYGI
jgi:hypothetical protein